jgi:general secretion pathway protein N
MAVHSTLTSLSASARSRPTHPRPAWAWALIGMTSGLLCGLLFFAPAHWLTSLLSQLSQERVLWQQTRGTVWSGSAQLILSGGPGSQDAAALPGRIEWSLQPRWDAGLDVSLRLSCCTPQALQTQVHVGWSGLRIQVQDGQSFWPAAVLTGLGTPWNTLQVQGQLQLKTQQLQLMWAEQRLQVNGQASLGLIDLSSTLSTLRPMGSYQLLLTGGSLPRMQLETLQGRLNMHGRGEWVGGRWRFEGEASAAAEHEAALSNLLNVLGQRQGSKALLKMG